MALGSGSASLTDAGSGRGSWVQPIWIRRSRGLGDQIATG
ncbi:hypothetical protein HMPREF9057_01156 [Actinomyces sp. oral taxon 171 str. F0337]|nr:hypothetical protein HMPREF9057_01156 [Actinomyces sp. oral taxon 171 str. F0337]